MASIKNIKFLAANAQLLLAKQCDSHLEEKIQGSDAVMIERSLALAVFLLSSKCLLDAEPQV